MFPGFWLGIFTAALLFWAMYRVSRNWFIGLLLLAWSSSSSQANWFMVIHNLGTNDIVTASGSHFSVMGGGACGVNSGWVNFVRDDGFNGLPPGDSFGTFSGSGGTIGMGVSGTPVCSMPAGWHLISPPIVSVVANQTVDVYVWYGNQKTNCTWTFEIRNATLFPQMYAIIHAGTNFNQYVMVNPNSTVKSQVVDPDCGTSWVYERVYGGSIDGGTVTQDSGGGGYTVTNPRVTNLQLTQDVGNNNMNLQNPGPPNGNTNLFLSLTNNPFNTNVDTGGLIPTGASNNIIPLVQGMQQLDTDLSSMKNLLDADLKNNNAELGAISNFDYRISTNGGGSNSITVTVTNLPATNTVNTNDFSLATTNTTGAAAATAMGGISDLKSALSGASGSAPSGAAGLTMTIAIGGTTIDCNPYHQESLAAIAAWVRSAFTWFICIGALVVAWGVLEQYLVAQGSLRQATTAGETVLGTNVNAGSALAMAIVITLVLVALPLPFIAWLATGSYVTNAIVNPFSGGLVTGPVADGIMLLNGCFPIDLAFYVGIYLLVYRMGIGVWYFVAAAVVRACTGL